jgi:hypothetical protein
MPDLILRATNSPYGDINKGSVLSQTELDTNFITLKGLDSTNLLLNGSILSLERYSGDNLSIDLSGITSTPFTGGTVIGPTEFLNDVTTNTISATTYYNLPMDVYISGMTFNNGNYNLTINRNDGQSFTQSLSILSSDMTITGGTYNPSNGTGTFTNNSGGTFNVTGFLTGYTDTYTTGATYSNNRFTFNNSSGTSFNVLFNTMTGLTINGINATGTSSSFTTKNSNGFTTFDVRNDGGVTIGQQGSILGAAITALTVTSNNGVDMVVGNNILQVPANIRRYGGAGTITFNVSNPVVAGNGLVLGASTESNQNASGEYNVLGCQVNNVGQSSSTFNSLKISPTINLNNGNTTSSAVSRGVYYNPTVTNLTGVGTASHRAWENTSGNMVFGSLSGNTLIGTVTDSGFKLDVNGSSRFGNSINSATITSGGILQFTGSSYYLVEVNSYAFKANYGAAGLFYSLTNTGYEFFTEVAGLISTRLNARSSGSDLQKRSFINQFGGYLGIGFSAATYNLDVSGTTRLNGDLTLTSGTNKTTSVVVLTGGNPSTVVVNNSLVKTSSLILLTKQTAVYSAGTPSILTKTNGSFTIISSANGDTDSVGYLIINTT